MEGEHILDSKGLVRVVINNTDNLTLRGESGHSNTDVIIRCGSNTRGLVFNNGSIINIYDITITGCGQQDTIPLSFTNIASLYIHHITLYNNIYNGSNYIGGGALYIHCVRDTYITITNSAFTNNTVGGDGGGLCIYTNTGVHNNITITNSAFTNNTVGHEGGGLDIYTITGARNDITITNSAFTNNTVGYFGGGLYIDTYNGARNNITITNSTFTNNTVGSDGGGLLIATDNGTHNNITITNSALTNNTVGGDGGGLLIYTDNGAVGGESGEGGGLYIYTDNGTHNNITITNSALTNNTVGGDGGGLCIYTNTGVHNNITITNSTFTNNTFGYFGGGLYIDTYNGARNNITITNSTFTNNTVGSDGGGLLIATDNGTHNNITITNSALTNNTVGGDGGGLYIYTNTGVHNNITITNSTFTNNTVGYLGGGLYIDTYNGAVGGESGEGGGLYIYTDNGTHNNITITNSTFTNNTVGVYGGGLYINTNTGARNNITITNSAFTNNTVANGGGLYIHTYNGAHNDITITNSTFTNNTVGDYGGGLYISTITGAHNNITITNSAFTNNTVGHNGGGLHIYTYNGAHNDITITNSTFTNNAIGGHGGGLAIETFSNMDNCIIVNSTFANNHGSGILIGRVTVIFTEGHSIVANNSSPTDGGGIFLSENSHLTTSNGGHVSFINNTANRYGGAIYSTDNDYTSFRSNILYRTYLDQCTVYNLSATFINNSAARAGDHLYGGVFTFCNDLFIGNTYLNYLLQCINVPDTLKHAPSVHPLSPVSSDPIVVCPCVNGIVDCNIASLRREVYPGQVFNASLVTVGFCGGVSPGTVVVEHDEQINLIYATTTDYTSTSCTTLNYTVKLTTSIISNTIITINIPDGDIYNIRSINVNLTILPCPLGLVVDFTSGDCVCNNDITHISICDVSWMPYPIQRSGNNWIYHRFDYYNCTIAHIGCPFDYCLKSHVKFTLNESDLQCNYNRSGILCGQCIQGLSLMIGSNRCANCTDMKLVSVSIIILAAVAGVVLVILLMILNLTVSVGSVNGLLFYANLVKLNESVFFPNGNIPAITQFISWCNLDLGFEYCFVDGLDGYVKTWLQFVFPLYVWFLVVVIIVGCRYSGRLSRLCGRNAVPVLTTLILMSYTKLSRTVTNALMMNTLQCGEYKWRVWNVDGNIDYLGGKHAVLFAVSLLFLVTGLVYTGLVFSSQWLQRYSGKCCESTRDPVVRLKPLIDAYTGPFKDKYRFWTGLCLIVRLMLTVVFSFTTTLQSKLNNYIILLIVIVMIVFIAVSGRVYKDKRLTLLEILSYLNIICLCVMTVLFTDSYSHVVSINVIVSVSVSIEILLFFIIVTVHCYLAFKKVFPNCKSCCKTHVPSEDELPIIAGDTEGSPARVITRREELIFDLYLNEEHP